MTSDAPAGADDADESPFTDPPAWTGPSSDPNDAQFGDAVEPATLANADDFDAVLVGEPYDGAVIGRSGAAEGPAAIRESLAATKTHHVDVGPVVAAGNQADGEDDGDADTGQQPTAGQFERIGDLGDVRSLVEDDEGAPDGDVAAVQERVREVARGVHASDAFPVFLGGDNSLSFANAAPLLDEGSVGVVSFDAHLDCRAVRPDVGPTSGTPYRQLFEAGLDSLAVVGARHFETATAYHDYLRDQGGSVVTPGSVGDSPVEAVETAVESLGDVDRVYVSLDVDVLDGAVAPGVSAPTPGGLSTRELFRGLSHVGMREAVAGFEVVECAPPLDRDGRTVDAAARAVAHFLAGRARRRANATERGPPADPVQSEVTGCE